MFAHSRLYWLTTGAIFGMSVLGALDALAYVFPCLAVSLILAIAVPIRLRTKGLWAFLVGLGGVPALWVLGDVVTAIPWHCIMPGKAYKAPLSCTGSSCVSNGFYCVNTLIGPVNAYFIFALPFVVIALIGFAFPLAHRLRQRGQPAES